jgi:hypothetical protein
MCDFRWIPWNVAKCGQHGVDPAEAEFVVERARRPYPRRVEDGKYLVWGQAPSGRYLQVAYLLDSDGVVFVIHAMPLTTRMKRRYRRRQR